MTHADSVPPCRKALDTGPVLDAHLVDCDLYAGFVHGGAHRIRARRIDGDPHRHTARTKRGRQQGRADRTIGLGGRNAIARHEETGNESDAGGVRQRPSGSGKVAAARFDQGRGATADIAADQRLD
jgi:hypothetical protein